MNTNRFPSELIITENDYNTSEINVLLKTQDEKNYHKYHDLLSDAARNAMDSGETAKGKILWLLADACSMMLSPDSHNEPFKPFCIIQDKRSAIPEDFSENDLVFFENILPAIVDFRLRARIADILWLRKKPKNKHHALAAIESYMEFPLDQANMLVDGREAWERAICLSLLLGDGAAIKVEQIHNKLRESFGHSTFGGQTCYHLLWQAKLLIKLPVVDEEKKQIALKLEEFAKFAKEMSDCYCSQQYCEAAIEWYKKLKDDLEIYRLYAEIAELLTLTAEQRADDSKMAAAHFYEESILYYRKIPKSFRDKFNADSKLHELHKKMNQANIDSLSEMSIIETPLIDITEYLDKSRTHVSNRNFPEVLIALANVHVAPKVQNIQQSSQQQIEGSFSSLFSCTHMTTDGRVAARTPGINLKIDNSDEYQNTLWANMLQQYQSQNGIIVHATILPALDVTILEHRITINDLLMVCKQSSIIPHEREFLWAQGLFYGFEKNFIISTHLLIPQIEHFVRIQLKKIGQKTTTLDSNRIETENGLSTLLSNEGIQKVFDENLLFELRALLTDPIGANLRNEVAHGLVEVTELMSISTVYLWWLCLRLVINNISWKKTQGL